MAELLTGLGIFKTLFDTAKGLKDINDAAVRNAAIVELQEKIFAAQNQQAALIERVGELEEEMARMKAWEAEKERYELVELSPGVLARAVKESMRGAEPPHYICADCYEDGKKRHLQSNGPSDGIERLRCHGCKTELVVRFGGHRPPRIVREPPRR
jgi:hypothetical protein